MKKILSVTGLLLALAAPALAGMRDDAWVPGDGEVRAVVEWERLVEQVNRNRGQQNQAEMAGEHGAARLGSPGDSMSAGESMPPADAMAPADSVMMHVLPSDMPDLGKAGGAVQRPAGKPQH